MLTVFASAAALAVPAAAQGELEPPIRLEAGGAVIDTVKDIGHSGPQFYDLDGDGLKDLLVGDFIGHVLVFKNVGTAKAPKFEAKGPLAADGEDVKIHNW
jgi:hypothetical protein